MLVFIDDSGDPGFKLEKGSSPFFVITKEKDKSYLEMLKKSGRIEDIWLFK